jgi:shikimate kinase
MPLVVLTGASGSGKTTLARAIAARRGGEIDVHFFDSVGVPPVEQTIAEHGSGEGWQRAKTIEWMHRLVPIVRGGRKVLLEGGGYEILDTSLSALDVCIERICRHF